MSGLCFKLWLVVLESDSKVSAVEEVVVRSSICPIPSWETSPRFSWLVAVVVAVLRLAMGSMGSLATALRMGAGMAIITLPAGLVGEEMGPMLSLGTALDVLMVDRITVALGVGGLGMLASAVMAVMVAVVALA